jgi:hypothetical protein
MINYIKNYWMIHRSEFELEVKIRLCLSTMIDQLSAFWHISIPAQVQRRSRPDL